MNNVPTLTQSLEKSNTIAKTLNRSPRLNTIFN